MSKTLAAGFLAALWMVCGTGGVRAGEAQAPIELWPGQVPGEKGDIGPEKEMPQKPGSKQVLRLSDVTQPTITVFRPAADADTHTAVVICPGGGYNILAYDLEGTEVAQWFNTIGVTGVVLKYRVPARQGLERYTAALQDVQRAVGLVRDRASQWGLNPERIGVLGFSAGGHLAATTSNQYEKRTYEAIDEADKVSCKPDFTLLIYPAYLVEKDLKTLSPELNVTKETSPTFIAMTEDDGIHVECGLFYYLALKQNKVPAEMHLYPSGGHGYGLRPSEHLVSTWPQRAEQWMRSRGLLERAK